MTSLAATLAVALALGAGGGAPSPVPSARSAQAGTNAARARAGLLPRKPAKKVRTTTRSGRRIITAVSHQPTWLGEPEPIPDAPDEGAVIELVAAAAPEPTGEPELEPLPAPSAPVLVADEVRLSASDVVAVAKLSLRFP